MSNHDLKARLSSAVLGSRIWRHDCDYTVDNEPSLTWSQLTRRYLHRGNKVGTEKNRLGRRVWTKSGAITLA